jgi:DNA-binding CsgD family transcriptional regulator
MCEVSQHRQLLSVGVSWTTPTLPGRRQDRAGGFAGSLPQAEPISPVPTKAEYYDRLVLLGRDAERARIAGLLDEVREGRSGVLVLRGEPGVGKSALLADAIERAAGMTVLTGGGIESETHLPYAGLHQIVRPVLSCLEHLPSPQARALRGALGLETGVGDELFLVSLAVLSLLAEAAEHAPVLCVVDDAHWLDDASSESLVFAARRLKAEAIAILFAARDTEVRRFDAPGLDEQWLSGLDADAAGGLLDRMTDVPLSPEARERLIGGTGGNPLALIELSSTLSQAELSGLEPLAEPLPVGSRIESAFLSRVRRLPEATQTILLVAAAEDTGDAATVLAAAERLGVELNALDAAERAGLVQIRGPQLDFRHPLIRSAVYQSTTLSQRLAVHEALASVLVGEANLDRRAWHRAIASVEPDMSVAQELEQAARRARRRSGFVAASLAFERAAALSPDESDQLRLLTGAVEGAWFSGRLVRALALSERARPLAPDAAARAEIDCWRGLIELNAGVPADAGELLLAAAADMATIEPRRALYILGLASVAAGYSGRGATVGGIAERASSLDADDAVGHFLTRFVRGMGGYFSGDFASAADEFRGALELADAADADASAAYRGILLLAGGAALFLGDDGAAERLNQRLAFRAREAGHLPLLTQALPRLALAEMGSGLWSAAAAGLSDGIALARAGAQHQVVAHMLSVLALLAGLRGDEDECRSYAAESKELASARRLAHVALTAEWALLALELGHGRASEALACAREITELPIRLWAASDRVEAAIRADEPELAAAWLGELEAWSAAAAQPWAEAASLRCRGFLAGESEEADDLFTSALAICEEPTRPFECARTELAFGEFLRRTRRRREAREHLKAALQGFESLGAVAWAERARIELRASGQTARRREPSTRDDLTAQERQIARLVAEGLSNRDVAAQLFLSPRTIDFHLRNVFRKLGISSRMQLVQFELRGADVARTEQPAIAPVRS